MNSKSLEFDDLLPRVGKWTEIGVPMLEGIVPEGGSAFGLPVAELIEEIECRLVLVMLRRAKAEAKHPEIKAVAA